MKPREAHQSELVLRNFGNSLEAGWGFPGGLVVKNPPPNTGDAGRGLDPWVRKIPRSREWLPTSSILV